MTLTAREGPIPEIWRYNLNDGTDTTPDADASPARPVTLTYSGTPSASEPPDTSPTSSHEVSSSNSPPRPSPDSPGMQVSFTPIAQPGADDRTARNERTSCAASASTSAI